MNGAGPDPATAPGSPDRLYILTGTQDHAEQRTELDLVTLIVSRTESEAGLQPEHAAIVRMCHYPLSVAEISAYLELPVSTLTQLLTELLTGRQVEARPPVPAAALPDVRLLEAVMNGLQKL
ncbi:DUF742 domain-containing protein [Streptomyces albireticuli]|uniref:DUF742 domain-containing protein n=1 Tax=Streptomyces albireticuli TaxID=1940 RepID=A0A2A2D518_9ACTN|nr:DUF742 domain-containing protein [Streptomyces albireticuli]MCD9145348.1 DUF742 domain-containing protein [Streptomyces albireticuli]MCD9166027.1 DUF742 domain-containing protein [Streptomyces albireticuli]MCD9196302.1 DUF742 domain-containing protein [Streptomyces albireticuli]PAU47588.1 hypothetical protein CK936_17890 [Streptomyces albireticuli]